MMKFDLICIQSLNIILPRRLKFKFEERGGGGIYSMHYIYTPVKQF